jgi:hypothetical protein
MMILKKKKTLKSKIKNHNQSNNLSKIKELNKFRSKRKAKKIKLQKRKEKNQRKMKRKKTKRIRNLLKKRKNDLSTAQFFYLPCLTQNSQLKFKIKIFL